MNWLAEKLSRGQARVTLGQARVTLGQVRAVRRFDPNNYERILNDLTGRVTNSQSQRLQTAIGIGRIPSGLLVGGQVSGGGSRIYTGIRQGTPYINPVTGTQILPGNNTKTQGSGTGGGGARGGGRETSSATAPVGTVYVAPKRTGAGGLPRIE